MSVVTVSYWTGPVLRDCVTSLLAQRDLVELILINNGNDAATEQWLRERAATDRRFILREPGRNMGFAAACNLGAAPATGDYIAFVNPDCVLAPDTLAKILDVFEETPEAWLCGGRLQHPDGKEQRGGRREILSPWRAFVELLRLDKLFPNHPYFRRLHQHELGEENEVVEVPTVSGAFMVTPKRYFDRINGFDDNMFLHFDDADLCIRINQAGGKVIYCGHVPVTHHLSTSDVGRLFIEWHKTRSTSYYFYKHFHQTYPFWFLRLVSALLWVRYLILIPRNIPRDIVGWWRRRKQRKKITPEL